MHVYIYIDGCSSRLLKHDCPLVTLNYLSWFLSQYHNGKEVDISSKSTGIKTNFAASITILLQVEKHMNRRPNK